MNNRKVLMVTSSSLNSNYGGGQVYFRNLVYELIRQDHSPIIVIPDSGQSNIGVYLGCEVVYVKLPISKISAIKILNEVKPDLVHIHGFKAIFAQASRELKIPCITTVHHGGILCPAGALLTYRDEICRIKANPKDCFPCVLKNIRGGIYAWPFLKILPLEIRLKIGIVMRKLPFILYLTPVLQASSSIQQKEDEWKAIIENVSLIIAPSDAIAKSLIINGATAERIKVLPHGIPLPKHADATEILTSNEVTRFFYIGRICHIKGVHVMLKAFNTLKMRTELHLIGGAGNKIEERYMNRLKKKYKNDHRIQWHGKINSQDILDTIRKYDVMIHPTICLEVFGLNIAEALAMGKPVISTRSGGPEMQIVNCENGILVNPNNANEIKEAINKIVHNEINLNPYKKKVVSIKEHVKDLLRIYEETTN